MSAKPATDLVGSSVLKLITSGMYTDPLAVYKEYIQNAVDSLAESSGSQPGEVRITIDASQSRISIRDNGAGLSRKQALRDLIPISRSRKEQNVNRGFRGIGRLAGLVFGESVSFYTRQKGDRKVFRVKWDGNLLESGVESEASIDEIISASVTAEWIDCDEYPEHFFEVEICGISRYAASKLLNIDEVRKYIGQVCPVPFDDQFTYRTAIESILKIDQRYSTINIYLSADEHFVTKPLKSALSFPNGDLEDIQELEKIHVPALSDDGFAAIGWIAHWAYSGALSKSMDVRGMRARIGNIQIGDEFVFDHLFAESRFNRWSIAEIHIIDPNILPNAKRDYFEPSPHLRNLENHLAAICRKLERRCRSASKLRNSKKKINQVSQDLTSSYELAASGYLSPSLVKAIKEEAELRIEALKDESQYADDEDTYALLCELEKSYKGLCNHQTNLNGAAKDNESVPLSDVFSALVNVLPSHAVAHQTIESILSEIRNQN